MIAKIFYIASALALSGCVTPAATIDISAHNTHTVPAKTVIVTDLSRATNPGTYDTVWASGFFPLKDDATNPPFRVAIASRIRNQFLPDKIQGKGQLRITLVESVILQKTTIADSVVFISIASALSPREFQCGIDVNLEYQGKSERHKFIYLQKLPLSWVDAKQDDKNKFAAACMTKITDQMNDAIRKMVTL